jgi:protoheme IX farnesyltransferase
MTADFKARLKAYYVLIKPGIVYSNVMTGLAGYLFASKFHVDWINLIGLLLGMSSVIASACVYNNYLDQGLDAKMKRTQKRALVTGLISNRSALTYATLLAFIGFSALLLTNLLTWIIGLIAMISYVIVYGYVKRHSVFGTLVGTVPGAASIVAGYTAYTGHFDIKSLLLFFLLFSWQMAHFYAIATYRVKDYKAADVPVWSVIKGLDSTKLQIRLFIFVYVLANLAMSLDIKSYFYGVIMLIACLYWARAAFIDSMPRLSSDTWGKKVFLSSLIVILTMSVSLSVARII